jgi:hypothetical protein
MQQHYLKHRLRHQIETDERRSHGTISVMKRGLGQFRRQIAATAV